MPSCMGRPIKLFNNGQMGREFTYINDVVEAVAWLVVRPPEANPAWTAEAPDPATSQAPWRVYNIGNSKSVEVEQVVRLIEQIFGKSAIRELLPLQPGNVLETYADVSAGRRGASPAAIPAEWICTGDDIGAGRTCDMVALRIVIGFGPR
jgi:UDP-glucuronate 4-epimerase